MFFLAALLERPDPPRAHKKGASGWFLLRCIENLPTAPPKGRRLTRQPRKGRKPIQQMTIEHFITVIIRVMLT